MEDISVLKIYGIYLVFWSIFTYFIGFFILHRFPSLLKYNIPEGIVGGLPICFCFYLFKKLTGIQLTFDLQLRDFFLLFFFCTVGMLANVKELLKGGWKLVKLIVVLMIFLFFQNAVGVFTAFCTKIPLVNGMIAGSITLAGGHGTAISWGKYLESLGHTGAMELGLVSATIGLIMGGLFGGPAAIHLIKKHALVNKKNEGLTSNNTESDTPQTVFVKIVSSTHLFLRMLLFILFSIIVGHKGYQLLKYFGIIVPEYLPPMFTGMIFINFIDFFSKNIKLNNQKLELLSNISLQIFITMSMIAIDLECLFNRKIMDIAIIIIVQVVFILFFAKYIFFRVAGKNYDAAVLTAGFIGAGLGAVPVGLANISSVTRRYMPSVEALLLLPLLGSVFTDLINAVLLKGFLNFISSF